MENASTSTENEQNDATTTEDQMEYDAGCPFILEVKYNDGTQKEYELMMINEDDQHKPCFSLPHGLNLSACLTASYMMLSSTQTNMGITGLHKLSRMLQLEKSTFSFMTLWNLPKVASVKQMCSKYNVYLCKEHFATYHFCGTSNNEDDEMDESEFICHTVL